MHLDLRFIGAEILANRAPLFTEDELSHRNLHKISACMHEHMLEYEGVGLAGPQIGIAKSVFTYNDQHGHSGTIFNPSLKIVDGDYITEPEGCLSIPGYAYRIPRYSAVLLKGKDINGEDIKLRATGYLARIFQHEVDHLQGRLYIDYLPRYIANNIMDGSKMEYARHEKRGK